MQYRPRLWIGLLIGLYAASFLIGFQPIRLVRQGQTTEAVADFDLGEPAARNEAALPAKATDLRHKLERAGLKAIEDVRFLNPSTLRVVTTALDETQRTTDRSIALSALQKEFKNAKVIEKPAPDEASRGLIARLGPIGIFRPVPQVRLGLDLQGGAHVVLQCKPSTEMTFATPEDHPMYVEEESESGTSPGQKAAAETKEQEKSNKAPSDTKTGPKAPGASTKSGEEPTSKRSRPAETQESLIAAIEEILKKQGTEHYEVTLPAPHRIVVRTQSTSADQVKAEREAILAWLQQRYPGVAIDAPQPTSVFVTKDTAAKAKHIIDERLYRMSDIKEPLVQTQGDDRIIVELPGVKDPERVTRILRSTAQLEFRLVPERYSCPGAANNDYTLWEDSQTGQTVSEQRVLGESEVEFTGRDLKPNATVIPGDVPNTFEVRFEIKESRRADFAEFTRNNVGRIMSIVLDGETKMAPVIRQEIPGVGVISGDMDAQEAGDLQLLLNAGALPVPLEIVENRQVSATLGADSIRQSMMAGLVGLVAVALFMIGYYRLPGMLANIALLLYLMIVIATLSTWSPLQATVTLPGIAGVILSIGMAVDANVIIFERLKEELRHRTTTRAAAEAAFHRAWTAILDANVTTMMVCSALYFLGTSAVKSFAVSLFVGVAVSLFTAVTVSRWLVMMAARSRIGEKRWWFGVAPEPVQAAEPAAGSQ